MSGRPLDVLEETLHEPVTVRLKDGEAYHGLLAGYDQHMNLVLDPEEGVEAADETATAVGDTTIIRGDNVVTIQR
ncbi:MAG: LSM domain-containing protein [Halobacteriaceae archaeon]